VLPENGNGYTLRDLVRWCRSQDEALKKLEEQMDDVRPDLAVVKAELQILNRRLAVLTSIGITLMAGLLAVAVTIALAVGHH
jgi:hypothetical protein